ncbi:hypothetical protein CPB85DRAFT_1162179, partial [Mucidula mucida]
QIRTISFRIINLSTILGPRWDAIVAENHLPPKKLLYNVSTRWNSTYDMINVALQYKQAIHDITGEDEL